MLFFPNVKSTFKPDDAEKCIFIGSPNISFLKVFAGTNPFPLCIMFGILLLNYYYLLALNFYYLLGQISCLLSFFQQK